MAKPKTRSRWKPLGAFAIAAIFISAVAVNFRIHDMERAGLTDAVRRSQPGQFTRLPSGITHYEIAGPAGGPTVVLIHGFHSVLPVGPDLPGSRRSGISSGAIRSLRARLLGSSGCDV